MDISEQNEEHSVEVIGGNAEPTTTETQEVQEEAKKEEAKTEAKSEDLKETDKSEAKAEKEKAENKEQPKEQIDNKEKPFTVSFDKKKDATNPDNKKEQPKETAEVTVTEQTVVEFLKKKGLDVNNISELSKSVELSDEVLKFQKFHEETGRGHRDFYNAQKDWSKEEKDSTLREFYKLKHNLSDENVEKHLNLLKISEDERDTLSERELSKREIEYDDKYREALGFMTEKSKEYKTSLDNRESQQKPLTKEQITELHRPYWKRRDSSLEKLTEVGMSLGEIGDVSFALTQDHKDLVAKATQTQESFFERFKDDEDNPNKINTDLSNEATLWGIKEIREEILSNFAQQMHTLFMSEFSKKNRNVDLDDVKKQEKAENKSSHIEVIGDNGTSQMGQSLI